jgi:hypothetical protein
VPAVSAVATRAVIPERATRRPTGRTAGAQVAVRPRRVPAVPDIP